MQNNTVRWLGCTLYIQHLHISSFHPLNSPLSLYTLVVLPLLLSHPSTPVSIHSSCYKHPNSIIIYLQIWQAVSHDSEYAQPRHTYSNLHFYYFMTGPPINWFNKLQVFLQNMHFQSLLGISGETSTLLAILLHVPKQATEVWYCLPQSHSSQQRKQVNVTVVSFQAVPTKCTSRSSLNSREGVLFSDLTLRLLPCCPHFPTYCSSFSREDLVEFSSDLLVFFKILVFWFRSNVTERLHQQQAYSTIFSFSQISAQQDSDINILTINIKKFQKANLSNIREVP